MTLALDALRATIGLVQQVGQIHPAVEAELSQLTDEDMLNFLMIAAISLFGLWVMTAPSRYARDDEDEWEDEPPDVCALCGETIDDWQGAVYPGPRTQAALGLEVDEALCKRCVARLGY